MIVSRVLRSICGMSVFLLLPVFVGSQPNPCNGPCNSYQHSYWPMTVGNKWTFRNTATHSPVVMTIQQSPSTFNCGTNPIAVYMYKLDPNNYWSPGFNANLRWYLGVKPNLDIIALGHYWSDFNEVPTYGTGLYRTATGSDPNVYPTNVLLRAASPSPSYSVAIPMAYFGSGSNPYFGCDPTPADETPGTWNVTWSYQGVSNPGFSGTSILAQIFENSPVSGLMENWYFGPYLGPVQITQINTGITLELMDAQVYQNRLIAPGVQLRDLLIATAGTKAGLNFDQWNYYVTQFTHQTGPPPEAVCMNPADRGNVLTVDQYLALLENRGTGCWVEYWPELTTIENLARNEAYYSSGLGWDHWNYYYSLAGYGNPVAPENSCMASQSYYDYQYNSWRTIYPNRYLLYSARQWYALVKYGQGGGTCQ